MDLTKEGTINSTLKIRKHFICDEGQLVPFYPIKFDQGRSCSSNVRRQQRPSLTIRREDMISSSTMYNICCIFAWQDRCMSQSYSWSSKLCSSRRRANTFDINQEFSRGIRDHETYSTVRNKCHSPRLLILGSLEAKFWDNFYEI